MDSKQFDKLVARLAGKADRRSAVKGVVGGALASVGVTSVASPARAKKNKGKPCKGKPKRTICHKGVTITVGACAAKKHLRNHYGDCNHACPC